jgi:predicted amidophosphoribosyltransferase
MRIITFLRRLREKVSDPKRERREEMFFDYDDRERPCPVCGHSYPEIEKLCPICGSPDPYTDRDRRGRRGIWHEDKQHCPECQEAYRREDDRFCRYCGTKRSERKGRWFEPAPNEIDCVYGPMPATLYYGCTACGHRWESSNWDRQHYCPACGKPVNGLELWESRLALVSGDGQRIILDPKQQSGGELILGRKAVGSSILQSAGISEEHLILRLPDCQFEEKLEVEDISTNGTYINDVRLEKNVPTEVKIGSRIRLADREFTLIPIPKDDA